MYSALIDLAYQIIGCIRCQSYHEASLLFPLLTKEIEKSSDLSSDISDPESDFYFVFSSISNSLVNKDYVLLADNLEELFIPHIKSRMAYPDAEIVGNYSIEPSSSGFFTAKYIPTNTYLHSNCNPLDEARRLAEFYFDEEKSSYVVYGLGLGYHVKALNDISLKSMVIEVYESDKFLIDYVKSNDCFNLFTSENIKIIHDQNGDLFLKKLSNPDTGLFIHYPSLLKISNNEVKLAVKRFYSSWNSFYQWKRIIRINFNKNIKNCPVNIVSEKDRFAGKNVYIIGGGPSVDQNIEYLINLDRENNLIVCVTTVLKKLLNCEISPDYAAVMDAQERTYTHMIGIEDCTVPIIINSAAFWKYGENHKGPKFLALQNGYPPSEILAAQNGYPLFSSDGTVTTLALDIAIRFKAKNIYFIGIDMAFPNGKTHASGTMDEKTVDTSNLIPIEDVNGNTVFTNELLYGYLKSIEKKISEHPEISFYNLSSIGAKIKGTESIMTTRQTGGLLAPIRG